MRKDNKSKEENVMGQKKITPEFITELQPDEVFVFGSNLEGMHGGGAALIAYRKFGAIWGQGVGLQGQSYGIPTMQGGVETIRPYVDEFIAFAKEYTGQDDHAAFDAQAGRFAALDVILRNVFQKSNFIEKIFFGFYVHKLMKQY